MEAGADGIVQLSPPPLVIVQLSAPGSPLHAGQVQVSQSPTSTSTGELDDGSETMPPSLCIEGRVVGRSPADIVDGRLAGEVTVGRVAGEVTAGALTDGTARLPDWAKPKLEVKATQRNAVATKT